MTAAVQRALRPEQLATLREDLLRTLGKLERSMRSAGESARPQDLEQDTVGRLSRIDALQNAGLTESLAERERVQLEKVVGALRRIEGGTFGTCNCCGGAIPFERLQIFPETQTCSACACTRA